MIKAILQIWSTTDWMWPSCINSDYGDFSIVDADITLELMNVVEKIVHEIEKYLLARI